MTYKPQIGDQVKIVSKLPRGHRFTDLPPRSQVDPGDLVIVRGYKPGCSVTVFSRIWCELGVGHNGISRTCRRGHWHMNSEELELRKPIALIETNPQYEGLFE